ncbi:hypothetical protein Trydic_g16957 [Trypoxylus dichotomus]
MILCRLLTRSRRFVHLKIFLGIALFNNLIEIVVNKGSGRKQLCYQKDSRFVYRKKDKGGNTEPCETPLHAERVLYTVVGSVTEPPRLQDDKQ